MPNLCRRSLGFKVRFAVAALRGRPTDAARTAPQDPFRHRSVLPLVPVRQPSTSRGVDQALIETRAGTRMRAALG